MARARREIRKHELKILWGVGAICAYPDCRQWLVQEASTNDPAAVVGDQAHIVASSESGPRGDPGFPEKELDKADNLLLLCPTHHRLVDAQDATFTIDELRAWKRDQERFVRDALSSEIQAVGFEELNRATRNLLATPAEPLPGVQPLLAPREKMARNELTAETEGLLNVGYLRYNDVAGFVARTESIESGYAERLAGGFRSEYRRLRAQGFRGDALFVALSEWSAPDRADLRQKAAAVAVLTYLFHICDVFES